MNTQVFQDFSLYPLKKYINSGIKATINTDNRTVSDTNYEKEIEFLGKFTPLTIYEIKISNLNAIEGAFISREEKDELIKRLNS